MCHINFIDKKHIDVFFSLKYSNIQTYIMWCLANDMDKYY